MPASAGSSSCATGKTGANCRHKSLRVATIAFGNGRFVAGCGDKFLYSADGEEWQQGATLELKGSIHFRKSAFGNGQFVAIGDWDPPGQKRISFRAATPDGEKLGSVDGTVSPARAIAFGTGRFVVVGPGGLRESSTDGKLWEDPTTEEGADLSSVVFDGKQFLAAGGKYSYTSPDGITWKKLPKPIPCSLLYAGDGHYFGASWGGNLWTSSDGIDWKKLNVPAGNSFEAIGFGVPSDLEK